MVPPFRPDRKPLRPLAFFSLPSPSCRVRCADHALATASRTCKGLVRTADPTRWCRHSDQTGNLCARWRFSPCPHHLVGSAVRTTPLQRRHALARDWSAQRTLQDGAAIPTRPETFAPAGVFLPALTIL